jgi:hypothetical protein
MNNPVTAIHELFRSKRTLLDEKKRPGYLCQIPHVKAQGGKPGRHKPRTSLRGNIGIFDSGYLHIFFLMRYELAFLPEKQHRAQP